MSEMAYKNKRMICWVTGLSLLMEVLYGVNYFTSEESSVLLLVIVALALIPIVGGIVIYNKNKESRILHYIMLYGYEAFYCGLLLYTHSSMVFTYIVPILFISMIYEEPKLCRIMGGVTIFFNVLDAALEIFVKRNTQIDDYEIQIVASISSLLFMVTAAKCIEFISSKRLERISEAKEKTDDMLGKITDSAKSLSDSVTEINTEAAEMASSGSNSERAINDIVSATRELNDIVQKQLEMSGEISELLDTTLSIANGVGEKVSETLDVTKEGNDSLKKLGAAVDSGKAAGEQVDDSMSELVKRVDEVVAILDVIQRITKKTSMLALNASIEAARAGEAGRGFAVVAEEIKDLSSETDQATQKIGDILHDLTECTKLAGENVDRLLEANEVQLELVAETEKSFSKINEAVTDVSGQIKEQGDYIKRYPLQTIISRDRLKCSAASQRSFWQILRTLEALQTVQ